MSVEASTEVIPAVSRVPQRTAAHEESSWQPRNLVRVLGLLLIGMGVVLALFIAFEFLFSGMIEQRSQSALLSQLETRMQITSFDSRSAPVPSGPIGIIRIPSLGVSQVMVEGSTTGDLEQGPGHLSGTPLPGEFGNAVVVGHRRLYGAPFGDIAKLTPGDEIVVDTGQGKFTYTVRQVRTVKPGESDVVSATQDSRLSLVTSGSMTSGDRIAVIAKLKGRPVGVPHRLPQAVPSDELGITGSTTGLLLAILWAQVLAVTVFLAIKAFRIWPRSITYLLVAPPVLMLLWLIFANLDRFLPGTL